MNPNNSQQKRSYSRLRRGMIFWYNLDESVDKLNVPKLEVNGREFKDYLLYGKRPWVLVSSDDACMKSPVVQICPLHTHPKEVQPNDVKFYFKDGDSVIKCEQIRTVNSNELVEYDCILDDDIMSRVDICLRRMLGLKEVEVVKEVAPAPITSASMEQIEALIMGIVNKQVEEAKRQVADDVDIDDAVLRISEGISNLFGTPVSKDPVSNQLPEYIPETHSILSPVSEGTKQELFASRHRKKIVVANMRKNPGYGTKSMRGIVPVREKGDKHHQWTEAEAIEFLHDCKEYNVDSLMKKYGCESLKELYSLRYNMVRKLEKTC